ncbi:BA14K family protein [Xanthobacter sp. V4C-4]|uniref:BA14K family protein n=1 Tax=Xanthobacter cornucopiae TaxID=3119924 RepID=UPI003729CBB9
MFGMKKVALAAAMLASGILSFSPVPAGAQALRLGLADQRVQGAAVEQVEWRGRPGGQGYRAPGRGPAVGRPGYGGPRYVRPGGYGRPVYRPAYGRPGYGGPVYGRPVYGRPGYGGPRYVQGGPGWNRPGWRPGPGPGPGWGHPGWRPPPGAWGPGRWYPGWGWNRPGWGWGYYDNSGAWIALGVASGVALGAAAAAVASEPVEVIDDSVAYCAQRYRSYNVRTGTYTGYDGLQHPCP